MIWSVPALVFTGIVCLIDFILRRKKWNENTKSEKNSLILTLVVSAPYLICSAYGMFLGIVGPGGSSPFRLALYEVVLFAGMATWIVCLLATVASIVLRKMGRIKACNRSLVIGLVYCAVMFAVSLLV